MPTDSRRLEDVCESEHGCFHLTALGNSYCTLGLIKHVDCPYLSSAKDHNGFYVCLHPEFNTHDYEQHKE